MSDLALVLGLMLPLHSLLSYINQTLGKAGLFRCAKAELSVCMANAYICTIFQAWRVWQLRMWIVAVSERTPLSTIYG
jgi:hypothetical protein